MSELKQFKLNIETQEKENILKSYAQDLSKNNLNKLKDEMNKYSVEEFEKEVAYTIFKSEKEADEGSAKAFTYIVTGKQVRIYKAKDLYLPPEAGDKRKRYIYLS